MGRLVLVLFALAGCDKLLSLDPIRPLPDGPPYVVCSVLSPPPLYCADFDEDSDLGYLSGAPVPLPTPTGNVTAVRRAPAGGSPPDALWIDSHDDTYRIEATEASVVTQIHATFALAVTRASSQPAELVELGVQAAAFDHCYVQLYIDPQNHPTPELWLKSHCGNPEVQSSARVLAGLPAELTPVTYDFDLAAGIATVQIAQASSTLPLQLADPVGGGPHVYAGMLMTGGAGPALALDDLVVTTGR
ncbi:MAG: hypothetical protein ACM31C_24130 [Acidobacteriota bacterium]